MNHIWKGVVTLEWLFPPLDVPSSFRGAIAYYYILTVLFQTIYFMNVYAIDKKEFEMGDQKILSFSHSIWMFFKFDRGHKNFISKKTFIREIIGYLNSAFILASFVLTLFVGDRTSLLLLFVSSFSTTSIIGAYSSILESKLRKRRKDDRLSSSMTSSSFLELLNRNEEFVFSYEGVKYEIVMGNEQGELPGLSLFLSDGSRGTFIQSFHDKEDFLNHGTIGGKRIVGIISKIVT